MKVQAIQTGTVAVKARQQRGAGRGPARLARTLMDRTWTQPLPIYAWLIEHPEKPDRGGHRRDRSRQRPRLLPSLAPLLQARGKEWVEPRDEIGPKMRALGFSPAEVRWVILTHLHTDHAGGLGHFPDSKPFGPFPQSLRVTQADDVRIVATHGHTKGHVSVVLDEGPQLVFFAGDSSYTQALMVEGAIDGVAPHERAARGTLERIRELTRQRPVVYLPSHDPEAGKRLDERSPV